MFTARDIEEYPLEKTLGGYKTESVDTFLDKVAADYQKLTDDNAALSKKITVLVESINKYRQEEDFIKSTLIEAQKLAATNVAKANDTAEEVISAANAQAEETVANANAQSEEIIADANAKAAAAIAEAEAKVEVLEKYFSELQEQVDAFRSHLLATYKTHIEAISELPVYEKPVEEEEEIEEVAEEIVEAVEVEEEIEVAEEIEEVQEEVAVSAYEFEEVEDIDSLQLEEISEEELLEEIEDEEDIISSNKVEE